MTAVCSGTTVNQGPQANTGYGDITFNNLNVTVVGGATVTGTGIGIDSNTAILANSGTVAGGAVGVRAFTSGTFTNAGAVSGGTFGFFSTNSTVVNSGSITSAAVGVQSTTLSLVNSGTISGITAVSGSGSITNSGTILGSSFGLIGSGTITNSGVISGGTTGIAAATPMNLTNTGLISGNIAVFGPGNVTNAGSIISTAGAGGAAVALGATNDTLTLLPGSRIIGIIGMGAGTDTVNVRSGSDMSWLVTVQNGEIFNTTGTGPAVISGGQIATLDPTPFALADRTLTDFTRGISGVIAGRAGESTAPTASGATGFASQSTWYGELFESLALGYADKSPVFKAPTQVARDGTAAWGRAFGGYRDHAGDDPTLPAISTFWGGAIGLDHPVAPGLRLGAFLGGGTSQLSIDRSAGGTDTDILFGGVYGRWAWSNLLLDAALHAGHLSNHSTRRIANNLAPGGFETASAQYDGWYVSPELGAGLRFTLAPEWTLTPAARVRYLHADLDGYTETGATANLTAAGRTLQNLEERFDLTLSRRQSFTTGDTLTTSVHAGVLGLHRLGGTTVNTVLLGVNLPFATPGEDNLAGLYGGAGFAWQLPQGVSFFGSAEAIAMSDQSVIVHGKGGLRVVF